VVYNIPLVRHRISEKAARQNTEKNSAYYEALYGEEFGSEHSSKLAPVEHLFKRAVQLSGTTQFAHYYLAGNITIGTPAQRSYLEFDFFNGPYLVVLDSKASYARGDWWKLTRFNSSNSSTYTSSGKTYGDWRGKGPVGSDIVNISGIVANVSFAALQDITMYYAYDETSGTVGLSPWQSRGSNISTNLISQLAPHLDAPIVSLWTDFSSNYDGNAQITLGSVDKTNCESDWIFTPSSGFIVNATSVTAKGVNGSVVSRFQKKP